MMLGARTAFWSGGGWKNPYVTDGLVAMWDGEWNAGGGIHDPNAAFPVDICGGETIPVNWFGTIEPHDKHFTCTSGSYALGDATANLGSWDGVTIEIKYTCSNVDGLSLSIGWLYYGTGFNYKRRIGPISGNYRSGGYFYNNGSSNPLKSLNNWTIPLTGGFSYTIESGVAKFLINGSLFDSISSEKQVDTQSAFAFRTFTGTTTTIPTDVYCIRVYNRALSEDEISSNHDVDVERFNLT